MQPSDGQSLEVLRGTLEELLATADPALDATLSFSTLRGLPLGIGGLIGRDPEVVGEVFGRRLEARARLDLRAADPAALDAAGRSAIAALLDVSPGELRRRGLLRLALDEAGPIGRPEAGGVERPLTFRLLFEHRVRPEVGAGGVILEIPLRTVVDASAAPGGEDG